VKSFESFSVINPFSVVRTRSESRLLHVLLEVMEKLQALMSEVLYHILIVTT